MFDADLELHGDRARPRAAVDREGERAPDGGAPRGRELLSVGRRRIPTRALSRSSSTLGNCPGGDASEIGASAVHLTQQTCREKRNGAVRGCWVVSPTELLNPSGVTVRRCEPHPST